VDVGSVTGLVIGVVSFVASIVFFILGSRSERRNQDLLNNINEAIQRWQADIMASSVELLNSRPEIVAKNACLKESESKAAFVQQLSERVRYIIEHPESGEGGPAQSHALGQLLQAFEATTKSSLPPELLAQVVMAKQGSPQGGA
jgi:dGTP triphosphohydrolase